MRPQGSPLPSVLDEAGGQTRRWGVGRSGSLKAASETSVSRLKRVGEGLFPSLLPFVSPSPVSTGSLAQQYAHPSASLHPHSPHPQPSATPTGQQQSQHGGSHPAPSPVQVSAPPPGNRWGGRGAPPLGCSPPGGRAGAPLGEGSVAKTRRNACPMQILLPSFSGRSFSQGVENECIYDGCTSWGWGRVT